MKIIPAAQRNSTMGPKEWFAGRVRVTPLVQTEDPATLKGVSVHFEAGARTAWHTHPLGQTLIITAGSGLAQTEGGAVQVLSQGDVVWFAPDEKHWHGASETTDMTHIALQEELNGSSVTWMEHVEPSQAE